MTAAGDLIIRPSEAADKAALMALYPQAFPDEDLTALVRDLLGADTGVVSLVAQRGAEMIGHVALTECAEASALLGPLAVHPGMQRQGVGTALVQAICDAAASRGMGQVFLLGDPNYYKRVGFAPETQVKTPYPIPEDWAPAWQSRSLAGAQPRASGTLKPPAFWNKPEYWS